MKLSTLLIVKAVISLVLGIAVALIPTVFMSLYAMTLDANGVYMARLVGALLIGVGLICWLNRNTGAGSLQNTILALFVADTIGFIVSLLGQLAGLANALGWVNVVLWLLLALGLGYFRFIKPSAA